jgi:hypothetical protein
MSITRNNPNTVFLGGGDNRPIIVNDLTAKEVITPGMLIERNNTAGVIRWQKATVDLDGPPAVALDQPMLNKGVDDDYGIADLVYCAVLRKGETAWMLIASGQNVAAGNTLGSAGGGTLKVSTTNPRFTALENKPTVSVLTRIRVEAL